MTILLQYSYLERYVLCENCLSKIYAGSDELGHNSRYNFVSAKNYGEARVGLQMPCTLLTQAPDQCELKSTLVV